jgi:hypothetical protein
MGNVSAQVGIQAVAARVGLMPAPHTFINATGSLTVQTDITPAPGGDIVAMMLSQGAGGLAAFDPPITTLYSVTTGHTYTSGYLMNAPGQAVTVLARLQVAANSRLAVYSFLPAVVPSYPLKVWDGSAWRGVART